MKWVCVVKDRHLIWSQAGLVTNDRRTSGCKWRWLQKGLGTDDLDHLLLPWAVSRPIIQRWLAEQHIHHHCHIPSQSPHHNHQKCHNWALARAWEGGFIYLSNSIERINSREILQVCIIHDVITHPIIGVITATVIIINVTQKVLGTDDLDDLWAEYRPGPPPEQLCRGGSMHRIFRVKNSRIDESIIRSKYWDAEVPQAFHSMLEKKDGLDFIKPQRSN